jgi:deazaflavin-dependent oxidoreductase (nitroreductase family)
MLMNFLNRMRYFNKHIVNRVTLKIAGAAHSPISAVHHVGRRSGKLYQTPVIVGPVDDGFVFALTYGAAVDWYRNVLAAGGCTLLWHGGKYTLENPETIAVEAALPAFPLPLRLVLRIMCTRHFFRMKSVVSVPWAEKS